MQRLLFSLLLSGILLLTSCAPRDTDADPAPAETETSVESSQPEESESSQEEKTTITDPEEISEAITIAKGLLENADLCDQIYAGKIDVDPSITQSLDGTEEYELVTEGVSSVGEIETLWKTTFSGSKAESLYNNMVEAHLYVSINGELYLQHHEETLPPLMMGTWSTQNIEVLEKEEDFIVVRMDTTLVGQPNGTKELRIEKHDVEGHGVQWLLTDDFFLG